MKNSLVLQVAQVKGEDNSADLLTKPNRTIRFNKLLAMIGSKAARRGVKEMAMMALSLIETA